MKNFFSITKDQIAGAHFMASRPVSMLADKKGLGKTAQVVHACDILNVETGAIICKPILRDNIIREFETWGLFDRELHPLTSSKDEIPKTGIVVLSYNLAANVSVRDRLRKRGGQFLACDEAHAMKETSADRTKAVLSAKGIARGFDRMAWITASPAKNDASEYYTFARAAGVWLDTKKDFIATFCREEIVMIFDPKKQKKVPLEMHGRVQTKIVGNKNPEQLKKLLEPVLLRRSVIEGLPPLRVAPFPVSGDARALNAALDKETCEAIEAAAANDEWQFFETPYMASIRRLAGIAKAPSVADLVADELEEGEPKIVVFAYHKDVIRILAERLAKYKPLILDGSTKPNDRQPFIDRFQDDENARVIICQNVSGGEGITLTASSRIILAEPEWTPEDNDQIIARCWRRGQTKEVHASLCTLAGSIDDRIMSGVARKIKVLSELQ